LLKNDELIRLALPGFRPPKPLVLPLRITGGFLIGAVLLTLSGCSKLAVLTPAGPAAAGNSAVLLNAVTVMLFVVTPTIFGCLFFAWWYRASNERAVRHPKFVFSGRIELLVWSLPFLTIVFLGGIIWIGSHQLDPAQPVASDKSPIEIQVVSLDWKWLFLYPQEGVATVNRLIIPTNVPVHFSLTSATVMNSFFVPRLGGMIAVMNGMVTHLNLMADHPGNFHGFSTQFSGDGFADMSFEVGAVSQDDFQTWLTTVRAGPARLDRAAYAQLLQPSTLRNPRQIGAIDGDLFSVITSQMISKAGP